MSPNGQAPIKKANVPSNLYTVILAVAFCVVLATAALVVYKCYIQYGTIFKMPT